MKSKRSGVKQRVEVIKTDPEGEILESYTDFETLIAGRNPSKISDIIFKYMCTLGENKNNLPDALVTFMNEFVTQSNLSEGVLKNIDPEDLDKETLERFCYNQMPFLDSLHDFQKSGMDVAVDCSQRIPARGDNPAFFYNKLAFSMMQNLLYKTDEDQTNALSGLNFAGWLPKLIGCIEDYTIILGIKKFLSERLTFLKAENPAATISGDIDDSLFFTKVLKRFNPEDDVNYEIKQNIEDFFSSYIDPGTNKINLMVDTPGAIYSILSLPSRDGSSDPHMFSCIITQESIADPAKCTNPLNSKSARKYFGSELYYEMMIPETREYADN